MAPASLLCASLCLSSSWAVSPDSAESNTLLQRTKVKALMTSDGTNEAESTLLQGTTGSELRLLESLATSVVKNGAKIDEDTKTELRNLIKNELDRSKDQIKSAHSADVQAGGALITNFQTHCQTPFETSQSKLSNDLAATGATGTKHSSHQGCRDQWRIDDHNRETECDELLSFNSGLRTQGQSVLPVPGDRAGMKDWWVKIKAFAAQHKTWKQFNDDCISAENKEDATLASCNTKQGTFENAICSDKQAGDAGCDAYTNCYTQAENDLGAARIDAEVGAKSRKIEWEAIIKIECFAKLLLNEGGETQADGSDKLTQESLDACKNKVVDTSHLDVMTTNPAFPSGMPAKSDCDMSPLDAYGGHPCTQNFESTSYDGYTDIVAPCKPCDSEDCGDTVAMATNVPLWSDRDYSLVSLNPALVGATFVRQPVSVPAGTYHYHCLPIGGKLYIALEYSRNRGDRRNTGGMDTILSQLGYTKLGHAGTPNAFQVPDGDWDFDLYESPIPIDESTLNLATDSPWVGFVAYKAA